MLRRTNDRAMIVLRPAAMMDKLSSVRLLGMGCGLARQRG